MALISRVGPNADAEHIVVERLTVATGARDVASGSIELARADMLGSDGNYHQMKGREVAVCDLGTGALKKAIVAMSETY